MWGTTIGSTVLQTQLKKRLPAEFLAQFPGGISLSYAAIPLIKTLSSDLQEEVRNAFARSIDDIWYVMLGIAVAGLLVCPLMKALPLHTQVDKKWELDLEKENMSAGSTPKENSLKDENTAMVSELPVMD